MRKWRKAALAALCAILLVAFDPASAWSADCAAAGETVRFRMPLPHTARAIRDGRPVLIVAIGSSSTEGVGASDGSKAYPERLAEELRRKLPGRDFTVVNKGVGGETATQMLVRFKTDVLDLKPQLVIWQVGSNAALKGDSPALFEAALRDGVGRLKRAKVDVVLMDPQYAPKVVARPAHRQIVDVIRAAAADMKVAVFRRYDAMRHWLTKDGLRAEDVLAKDQLHMNDLGYACIARLLASSLVAATQASANN